MSIDNVEDIVEYVRLYRTEVPAPMGGEQSLVLIERGDKRYGFVGCAMHSGSYMNAHKEVADDLKQYMEDNQVAPVDVQNSELVRAVLEEAEMAGVGVSGEVNRRLIDLLGSI